jgi:hypothetical protein
MIDSIFLSEIILNNPMDKKFVNEMSSERINTDNKRMLLEHTGREKIDSKAALSDHFEINALSDIHFSFTNIILYLTISFFIVILLNILTAKLEKLIYNNGPLTKHSLYDTLLEIVTSQINKFLSQIYLLLIYSLYIFLFLRCIIGKLLPLSFINLNYKSLRLYNKV